MLELFSFHIYVLTYTLLLLCDPICKSSTYVMEVLYTYISKLCSVSISTEILNVLMWINDVFYQQFCNNDECLVGSSKTLPLELQESISYYTSLGWTGQQPLEWVSNKVWLVFQHYVMYRSHMSGVTEWLLFIFLTTSKIC